MSPPASALRNIFRLVTGDAFAKALTFVAFVWLGRTLGVEAFGTLEFALAVLTWLLIFADGGLEIWATREVARGIDPGELVGRVVPVRMALATLVFGVLLLLLPLFPPYASLRTMLLLFSVALPIQAANLKWVFMGRERMSRVGVALALGQLVFAATVFATVREPSDLVRVPLARIAGDLVMVLWFGVQFMRSSSGLRFTFGFRKAVAVLRPALALGSAHALATISFNFDSLLLGFLATAEEVGLYGAAYKPIVAALALPVAYFLGLYPTLSRSLAEGPEAFRNTATSSLRLTWAFAVPVGIGSYFFAEDGLVWIFGPAYAAGASALRILGLSAVLVILRGTYRQGLLAADRVDTDLACGGAATALNVGLNVLLIPRFGIVGAASATLASEVLWLSSIVYLFNRRVASLSLARGMALPVVAGAAMIAAVVAAPVSSWLVRAALGVIVYTLCYMGIDRAVNGRARNER